MKLFTKFKLKHERLFKVINLDWREVAIEFMNDLNEERKGRFMVEQENYDLKQRLAIYKEKRTIKPKGRTIMINVLKAIKTIKKIEQLQKELHAFSLAFLALQDIGLMPETEKGKAKAQTMHDVSHMIKDILDGKSIDEATKRLEIIVKAKDDEEEEQEEDDDTRD